MSFMHMCNAYDPYCTHCVTDRRKRMRLQQEVDDMTAKRMKASDPPLDPLADVVIVGDCLHGPGCPLCELETTGREGTSFVSTVWRVWRRAVIRAEDLQAEVELLTRDLGISREARRIVEAEVERLRAQWFDSLGKKEEARVEMERYKAEVERLRAAAKNVVRMYRDPGDATQGDFANAIAALEEKP